MITWKEIYAFLKDKGYDVYSPGQHRGKCDSPYIVIVSGGTVQNHSTRIKTYELLMYYPVDRYSEFDAFIEKVRTDMKILFPRLLLVDDEQPHFLDDNVSAYMTSFIYKTGKIEVTNSYSN